MGSPVDDALDRLDSLAYDEQWILDALATVRQEVERLTKERGELGQAWVNAEERLRAAEAEVQRLTEGLREIAEWDGRSAEIHGNRGVREYARALLADRPDGGGAK